MTESGVHVSVVLPAYNEASTLEGTVEATLAALTDLDIDGGFELIIAEDGCSDDTPIVASALATEHAVVRHLHSEQRLGRGRALARATNEAAGAIIVYFDTDLATDLDHLGDLIDAISKDGYDIATGSRLLAASEVDRPLGRDIPSRIYNRLVRMLLGSGVYDHQCGFKAFDRDVLEALLPTVDAAHWFWDTEIIVRAQRAGYTIYEFPVHWEPRGDSTVDVPRDALHMGTQVLRLWWQLSIRPFLYRYRGIIALVLTLGLGYIVLETVADPGEILSEISRIDLTLLALAGIIYLASWPVRGLRYRDILRELGFTERIGVLTGAIFISQTGNLLVPARAGDAVRAYIVKARREVPYPTGFASLAIERIFDLLTITVLAFGIMLGALALRGTGTLESMLTDPEVGGGSIAIALAIGVAIVAIVGFGLLILSSRIDNDRFDALKPDEGSILARPVTLLARFLNDIRLVSTKPRAVLRIGLSSVIIWSIDVLTAIVILAAFGVDVSPLLLAVGGLFAVSVGNLAKIVPISPGGIGPYEAGFAIIIVSLTPFGVNTAVAAAIVDHALKNLITGVGGAISTGLLNVSLVTAVREGQSGGYSTETPLRE